MRIISYRVFDFYVEQCQETGYIFLDSIDCHRKRKWLRLKETKLLLEAFRKDPCYAGLEPIGDKDGSIGYAWAHPDIAIQFARWSSPEVGLCVSRMVREWAVTKAILDLQAHGSNPESSD